MLRLSARTLDMKTAKRYLRGPSVSVHAKGDMVILDLRADDERGGWDVGDDGTGLLSSLIPLRADIRAGDHRALYLAWLSSVQSGELNGDESEPPVPPGLGKLTASLQALANFLYVGADLITVAAARSQPMNGKATRKQLEAWIAGFPESEKTALLCRLATDEEHGLRAELLRRFHSARLAGRSTPVKKSRTVAALLDEAEQRERQPAVRAGKRDL
jgi:hypothetical protein